jgi:ESCRT-I complex subunit VPS28
MDNPAALHRIKVGVPATVEHSSEAGPETGKWIAETTQVRYHPYVSMITLHLLLRALSLSWMAFAFV